MSVLRLPSGFTFDYTYMLGPQRITKADLEAIRPACEQAWHASEVLRTTGEAKGHRSKNGQPEKVLFPQLPYVAEGHINTPSLLARLHDLREYSRQKVDLVVSLGVGGSYLGGKVLFDTHCGEFWNNRSDEERDGFPKVYFSGQNVDPRRTQDMVQTIVGEAERRDHFHVMLLIISKSGSTLEPMVHLLTLENALEEAGISYEVVAITDPAEGDQSTLLHQLAEAQQWKLFSVPDGIGGRFSVFTEVGLVLGALIGFNIEGFLAGARAMDAACRKQDMFENPAMLSAALRFLIADTYGKSIEVCMAYGDYLTSTSSWYVQLLAESLGKARRRDGRLLPYGRTPLVAVGTTDMHAQTQEHQEGLRNKMVTFLEVEAWEQDLIVPSRYPTLEGMANLSFTAMLRAAKESNEGALHSDDRPSMTYRFPTLNAFHLGEWMFLQCWAIFFEGELADVNPFDQPGVEIYKRLLGPKLAAAKEFK